MVATGPSVPLQVEGRPDPEEDAVFLLSWILFF